MKTLPWLLALCAAAAHAQSVPKAPAAPDPAAPAASAPALHYRSSLQRYRPLQEQPVADWRAANRSVHEAGGWRAYAREGAASAPAGAASAAHGHHH